MCKVKPHDLGIFKRRDLGWSDAQVQPYVWECPTPPPIGFICCKTQCEGYDEPKHK
jgi:hypothetical protein